MTILIIIITCFVSIMALSRNDITEKLQFNAAKVYHKHEYYRLISHGFVHANWEHLIVNMIVLYSFGKATELYFHYNFGRMANAYFLILYFGGMLFSNVYALIKYHKNPYYNAIGASGAVSSILFCTILFNPWSKIYFFGVLPIPGVLFALLYILYCGYMNKKGGDSIAHDAHLLGSVFGLIFPIIMDPNLLESFIKKLLSF